MKRLVYVVFLFKHFWMAQQIYAHQATNVHLIFHKKTTKNSKWGRNVHEDIVASVLGSFYRKNTISLVYVDEAIEKGVVLGSFAHPDIEFSPQERMPRCVEPASAGGGGLRLVSGRKTNLSSPLMNWHTILVVSQIEI